MSSIRAASPVKLFIGVLELQNVLLENRLEDKLISEYGTSDHRLSLIPTDGTIHRVFLSFERLIEAGNLVKIRELSQSIEQEFSARLDVGFLDNRRVAAGTAVGEDVLQFKDGGVQFYSWTPAYYLSDEFRDFFLYMRKTYRSQLRSMCLLRR